MNGNRFMMGLRLLPVLCVAFLSPSTSADEPKTQYKYSDEWSLVSAPPPAGPYQPVNIDPRIPGSDTIQQVPMAIPQLRATGEIPAEDRMQSQPGGGPENGADESANAALEDAPLMPPVPGQYQLVGPQTAGDITAESATGTPTTVQNQYTDEPGADVERAEASAVPATAGTVAGEQVVEEASGTMPEETTAMPPVQEETAADTTAESLAGSTTAQEEPDQPVATGDLTAESGAAEAVPASTENATTEQLEPEQEETGLPSTAGSLAEMPPVEEPATAMQEQAVMQAPMPGFYERMMPPAAGRLTQESPESPAGYLKGHPAVRPPAAGYSGYYGRPMPSAPGFNYPAPGRYPYQSGMPGYWNMPPYGYGRGLEWPDEQDVPPPPSYDSLQYPGNPARGYR